MTQIELQAARDEQKIRELTPVLRTSLEVAAESRLGLAPRNPAVPVLEAEPAPVQGDLFEGLEDEEDVCAHCGTDWLLGHGMTIFGCAVYAGDGQQWLAWRPCCVELGEDVQAYGFAGAYGRTLEEVLSWIAPELQGVEVLGDGTIVAKLAVQDPAEVLEVADAPLARAKSPSGWRDEVFADVDERHRHHEAPQGHKFSIAVQNGLVRVGVAVVSRPVSRRIQEAEPKTLEVTRVATWGRAELRKNAASKLYSAAGKKARALGAEKLITYTLEEENGASLRASGFLPTFESSGGSWNREGRARTDKAPTGAKTRWERGLTKRARKEVQRRAEAFAAQASKTLPGPSASASAAGGSRSTPGLTRRRARRITERTTTTKGRTMPKTRKKRGASNGAPAGHGGKRPGAGRKPRSGRTMKAGIYLRCSHEQKEALEEHVRQLSEQRQAKGLPKVDLSTWIRELALKHSGNDHLGLAAAAHRKAEAAASIV